jgi:hypothetical protein
MKRCPREEKSVRKQSLLSPLILVGVSAEKCSAEVEGGDQGRHPGFRV